MNGRKQDLDAVEAGVSALQPQTVSTSNQFRLGDLNYLIDGRATREVIDVTTNSIFALVLLDDNAQIRAKDEARALDFVNSVTLKEPGRRFAEQAFRAGWEYRGRNAAYGRTQCTRAFTDWWRLGELRGEEEQP